MPPWRWSSAFHQLNPRPSASGSSSGDGESFVGKVSGFAHSSADGAGGGAAAASDPQHEPPAIRYASTRQPFPGAADYQIVHVCPRSFQQLLQPELPSEIG